MNEALIVGALLLVLIGAVAFYLYSRILFNERKLGLIEGLLLDIRMNMDMEEDPRRTQGAAPFAPGPVPTQVEAPVEQNTIEADDVEEYKTVLEEAAAAPTTTVPEATAVAPNPYTRDYDALSREEVALIAEKRGIRVTKRMAKGTIIALLQEADKTAPQQGAATDVSGTPVESSAGGAPLDAVVMEEIE
jgi:hypothetical protein